MWTNPTERGEFIIGIDSGTRTGLAIWDRKRKVFVEVRTFKIHRAMEMVKHYNQDYKISVRVEDARKMILPSNVAQKISGNNGISRIQGAGSVKRDAVIWQDFLTDYNIPFEMVKPNTKVTKLGKYSFEKITGYRGLTSNHSRDAAMMVFGM